MEPYGETRDIFYLGARTEWLPAEHFQDIKNWDDSLKPSALYYIKQAVGWIASKDCTKECLFAKGGLIHSVHSGEKPFACNQCEKTFAVKSRLTYHLRIHSGEKPFACNQCEKTFAQKGHLTRHLLLHSGVKPFGCSQCAKRFTQKSSLTSHLLIHSGEKPFACSQCEKTFTGKQSLTRHLLVHSEEKPFACSQCEKTFTGKQSLTRHLLEGNHLHAANVENHLLRSIA